MLRLAGDLESWCACWPLETCFPTLYYVYAGLMWTGVATIERHCEHSVPRFTRGESAATSGLSFPRTVTRGFQIISPSCLQTNRQFPAVQHCTVFYGGFWTWWMFLIPTAIFKLIFFIISPDCSIVSPAVTCVSLTQTSAYVCWLLRDMSAECEGTRLDDGQYFKRVRKTAKSISFVMSVRRHGTTRLPLDGFSWNVTFERFSKICRENSSFMKIRQE